jgi:hypothetical protein
LRLGSFFVDPCAARLKAAQRTSGEVDQHPPAIARIPAEEILKIAGLDGGACPSDPLRRNGFPSISRKAAARGLFCKS